jgi:uncharacterized protein (TIGR02594 family)
MDYTYEDKLDFIASLYCPARVIADQTGCSWELILGQAAGETGWGEKCLSGTNNVFNIKADKSWHGPSKIFHVPETIKGKTVYVDDPFRVYPTIADSLKDRMLFLKQNPRYARLSQEGVKGNYKEEAYELQDAKYATDPEYADKLIKIIEGPTMRRGIARAQARGCGAALPVVEVLLFNGAKSVIADAPIQVTINGKSAVINTNSSGRFSIRITPKSSEIKLKVFDKDKNKWIDLETIKLSTPVKGINTTLIAPTFTVRTSTREHQKTSPPKPPPKPVAPPSTSPMRTSTGAVVKYTQYTVAKGDTLALIGARHGVRYQAIAESNAITSPFIIRAGQVLRIPDVKAALASQQKRHAQHTHAPTQTGESGLTLSALGQMLTEGSNSLHTVFSRNTGEHPQTDVMQSSRAPWTVPAQQEFEKGVKRRTGRGNHDPRIIEYFKSTPGLPKSLASVDETAYCAAFANWCLGRAGFKGTGSAGALSFKKWGRPTRENRPALGAVAVIAFPEGGHHVTFVVGISPDGKRIATLGGNQGSTHEVSHSYCPKNWVIAYRFPSDYPDQDDDYVLHDVASDHAPMSAASTH